MKTYKTITIFAHVGVMNIEHFDTLEAATNNYKKAIEGAANIVYILEEELHWSGSGDSENRILATYQG